MSTTFSLALSAWLLATAGIGLDDGSRRARDGVARGEYVRLETLLADADARYPGRVVDVELDDGEYEIEILQADGRVVELTYDARDGRLLETEIEDD